MGTVRQGLLTVFALAVALLAVVAPTAFAENEIVGKKKKQHA